MEYKPHTIGVLTSGGDAPGMNAALRAVTRAAISNDIKVKAIYRGYKGLIDGEVKEFTTQDVSGIIPRGGTIIKSARCPEFTTAEGRKQAYETLVREQIDALIVIGGDGTFTGARIFAQEFNIPVIGIPATIDNDLWGTDATIGYDTSLSTIMECIDKLRDTATSHERVFLVEVMGRDAGWIALHSAIAGGADVCLIPEIPYDIEKVREKIEARYTNRRGFCNIVIAEGAKPIGGEVVGKASTEVGYQHIRLGGVAEKLAADLKNIGVEHDIRYTLLGHLQRGGSPTASDRILASRMGAAAVDALLEGQRNVMVGLKNNEIVYIPFTKAIKDDKPLDKDTVRAQEILAS